MLTCYWRFGVESKRMPTKVVVGALPGALDTVAAVAHDYIAAGARHIVLYTPADPATIGPLARIADELHAHGEEM